MSEDPLKAALEGIRALADDALKTVFGRETPVGKHETEGETNAQ